MNDALAPARAYGASRRAGTLARMLEPVDPAVENAIAFLRGHLSGILRFDSEHRPIKIIVAPDGHLAASVMVAMIRSVDTTLCLPDEDDESMHLHVTLEQFDENGPKAAFADRWRIYHGDPPDVRWATISIDAARFNGLFIDGEALMRPNALAASEAAICKALNAAHTDLVRTACLTSAEVGMEKPIVVGVDGSGIDVRGAIDIVRLNAPIELHNEADALRALKKVAGRSV